jgi:hypothetical protein
LQINKECGFFEWIDPKLCEHGKRVVGSLCAWYENLVAEAKRCETMVEVEVGKVRRSRQNWRNKLRRRRQKLTMKRRQRLHSVVKKSRFGGSNSKQ